jgi:glucokinase
MTYRRTQGMRGLFARAVACVPPACERYAGSSSRGRFGLIRPENSAPVPSVNKSRLTIGIDLGGTNLRIAAFDSEWKRLASVNVATRVSDGPAAVVDDMCDAIGRVLQQCGPNYELFGVGVGAPGPLELPSGKFHRPPNLPGFDGFLLKEEMESRLHSPVIVEKDANAAALAEWKSGVGKEMPGDSMCMLTLGTGVGAGIILDRKIWHGMIGMGGEGGHIPLVEDGFACGCGGRGCLEQYASATAIGRAATLAAARGAAPRIAKMIAHRIQQQGEFSARDLAGLARDGDEVAREIFADAGKYLGMALATLVNVLNLPLYVIGGGVVSGWDLFAPRMFEELRRLSYIYGLTQPGVDEPFTAGKTYVVPAATGPDAGLLGAAMLPYLEAGLL